VRESFRGAASEWEPNEMGIRYVFDRCKTKVRYLEVDTLNPPGDFAAIAPALA
jgi:3-oxoacyl-[acyl-carrier-protein] synthase-3